MWLYMSLLRKWQVTFLFMQTVAEILCYWKKHADEEYITFFFFFFLVAVPLV